MFKGVKGSLLLDAVIISLTSVVSAKESSTDWLLFLKLNPLNYTLFTFFSGLSFSSWSASSISWEAYFTPKNLVSF